MEPRLSNSRPREVGSPRASAARTERGRTATKTAKTSHGEQLPDARLIRSALGYVPLVARRYLSHGLDFDELIAAGNLGLVQAALRFDPTREIKFVTYADWWIRKAILEALEVQVGPMRLPRYQYEKLRHVRRARAGWVARFASEPTSHELAEAAGFTPEEVDRLLGLVLTTTSLEQPSGAGDTLLRDLISDPQSENPQGGLLQKDLAAHLLRQVAALSPKETQVIMLRFGLGGEPALTLRGVGRCLAMSRERVRQIELRALIKLRCMI